MSRSNICDSSGSIARDDDPPERRKGLFFGVAVTGMGAAETAGLRATVHFRCARAPREIKGGEVVVPDFVDRETWAIVTIFGNTQRVSSTPHRRAHSTPIGSCIFKNLASAMGGVTQTAMVKRVGDDCFEVIGQAKIGSTRASVACTAPPPQPGRSQRPMFLTASVANLPRAIADFVSERVPYHDDRYIDTVAPVLAPFMEPRRRTDPSGWLRILKHVVWRQNARATVASFVDAHPDMRQLLRDVLAVVALRGEFYEDQLWGVSNEERRLDCDFYISVLNHPDPTAAAGDCEDRAMAVVGAFESFAGVEVSARTPEEQALKRLVEYARTFEACAVDTIIRDPSRGDELEKHMIAWLVPGGTLRRWEQCGAAARPDMPLIIETCFEIYSDPSHVSVLARPPPVKQESLARTLARYHHTYITLYCVADARAAVRSPNKCRFVVRDLLASPDAEHAGMPVPTPENLARAWSTVCTRARTIDVPTDAVEMVPALDLSTVDIHAFASTADLP